MISFLSRWKSFFKMCDGEFSFSLNNTLLEEKQELFNYF